MPDYLRKIPTAQDVWFEEIERVVAHGVTADHSSTFASYCVIEAALRSVAVTGELPKAAVFMERRKLAELLGIGGLAGRTSHGTNPIDPQTNPFAELSKAGG